MNKMYEYLKKHAYISYNKKSNYQFELSEERAQCIANKYDNLTDKLQQENKYLEQQCKKQKEIINKAIGYINENITISSILDGKKVYCLNNYTFDYKELLDILKEVSE